MELADQKQFVTTIIIYETPNYVCAKFGEQTMFCEDLVFRKVVHAKVTPRVLHLN